MIVSFLLSLIPILLSSLLAILTSGGGLYGVLDLPDFLGVTLVFAVCIFLSGYGKEFCTIFSSKKKFASFDLVKLQKIENALNFAGKILLYTTLFFPTMIFIALLYCTPYGSMEMHDIGPNSAICFLSVVYLCLFEMIICTLKAKVKKSVILYMAETDEAAGEKIEVSSQKIIKTVVGIVLLCGVCWLYAFSNLGLYVPNGFVISTIIDLPSFLSLLIFTLPLLAVSGNFTNFWKSFATLFSNARLNVAKKNLYLNAVKEAVELNWYGAITFTVIGWIGMMRNLEDASMLFPNIAVSLIVIFYAILLNLLLLLVENRIIKVSE